LVLCIATALLLLELALAHLLRTPALLILVV
jgi:hypothetical protein